MAHTLALTGLILTGLSLIYVLYRTIAGNPVDRRVVFIYVALAAGLPLFMDMLPPVTVTPDVQALVDVLEELPPHSKVLAAFDYDPPSAPELQPMAVAFFKFAFKKKLDVIIVGLWPQGPQQANDAIATAMLDSSVIAAGPVYGVDYVNLGFQSGNEFVIQRMGSGFKSMFPRDQRQTPYDSIPVLQNIVNFSNIDFIMNFSSGKPGTVEWVQIAVDRFGARLGAGNTAVQAPQVYPYLRANQMVGLLGGMSGAAEFEKALSMPGNGSIMLLSQVSTHAIVILFIIIGNTAYFRTRKRKND
ncbi:hypothetical protein JYU19_02605 [bacterium AH-315-J21]|nr:hypothetical protein [bacterium AH-315-J21]